MTSLEDALEIAADHWSGRPGAKSMTVQATKAGEVMGLGMDIHKVTPTDAVRVLKGLRDRGLAPKSVEAYYTALKRVFTLSEVSVARWPSAPKPPRKPRDELPQGDIDLVIAQLDASGWGDTGDLGRVMRATGLRVNIEALSASALKYTHKEADTYGLLTVTGKGGHMRTIPVVDPLGMAVLGDPERLAAVRTKSYSTHLRRWNRAVKACGVKSRLATPHAMRHSYGSQAHRLSGGNLVMAQELLGHADASTTATYLHSSLAEKAKALKGNP